MTPEHTVEYQHNALGNRIAKKVDGNIGVKYLWHNKTTLLATYDANNNLLQRFDYTLGHTPTAFTQGANRFYIVIDTNSAKGIPFGFAGSDNKLYGYVAANPIMFVDLSGLK